MGPFVKWLSLCHVLTAVAMLIEVQANAASTQKAIWNSCKSTVGDRVSYKKREIKDSWKDQFTMIFPRTLFSRDASGSSRQAHVLMVRSCPKFVPWTITRKVK